MPRFEVTDMDAYPVGSGSAAAPSEHELVVPFAGATSSWAGAAANGDLRRSRRPQADAALDWMACQIADPASLVSRLIEIRLVQAVTYGWVHHGDLDDLRQAARVDLLWRWRRFRPCRGQLQGFARRLVPHAISSELRRRWRKKHRLALATPALLEQEPDRTAAPTEELARELAEAIGRLPADLAQICQMLTQRNVSDTARELGMSRAAVYRRIERIRRQFEDHNLRDYL